MKQDKSPKGSIDQPILPFMPILNHGDLSTTSSCSGRVALFAQSTSDSAGGWLYVTHDKQTIPENDSEFLCLIFGNRPIILDSTPSTENLVSFKYEPFILHVKSKTIETARRLFTVAYNTGYRNSGLMVSNRHTMVAVRSTLALEVPVACIRDGAVHLFVSVDYLRFLWQVAMEKFDQNTRRMDLLLDNLKEAFKDC